MVAVESPGYPSAREAFTLAGARLLPIRVDAEGLDVEALARAVEKTPIRAVYVTPHCQDPTTVPLSARRRLLLLELARRHRFAVLEADYDHEFQFEGAPVLPMASVDRHGVVVLVGTLSKAIAPGLRMGFVAAPRPLLDTLVAVRGQVDRQGDLGLENAVAELLDDGEVQRHALRAKRVFLERRDLLSSLLRKELDGTLEFDVPRAGLALWARVRGVDVERWAAAARAKGVRFFTGSASWLPRVMSSSSTVAPTPRRSSNHCARRSRSSRLPAGLPNASARPELSLSARRYARARSAEGKSRASGSPPVKSSTPAGAASKPRAELTKGRSAKPGRAARAGEPAASTASTGSSRVTRVCDARRASSQPCARSSSKAATTVLRCTPSARASVRVPGSTAPGRSAPAWMLPMTAFTTCCGSGTWERRSTAGRTGTWLFIRLALFRWTSLAEGARA